MAEENLKKRLQEEVNTLLHLLLNDFNQMNYRELPIVMKYNGLAITRDAKCS